MIGRSDTISKPTPAIRRALAVAPVGDAIYDEDPTVNRLRERAADIFEKETALFVPTVHTLLLALCRLHLFSMCLLWL